MAGNLPPGFNEIRLVTGLDPTAIVQAPDGRIFIAEKNGTVRILWQDTLLQAPFVVLDVDNFNERGLCGITFDPAFEQNGYVYLFYSHYQSNRNRVSRVTAIGDRALPGSEHLIFEMDPTAGTIHNGGAIHFGPDSMLYIATGDGGSPETAQQMTSLLGKILRIHPDGSIPEDNPFYQQNTGVHRAIWALGFRNPFSFAIQPLTGRMLVNDVGYDRFEEINDVVAGGNYGWPLVEGKRTNEQPPPDYHDPLFAYPHSFGCAVIGAAFYPATAVGFPARYHGKYLFGDYCNGRIMVLDPDSGRITETLVTQVNRPLSFLAAQDGSFYYLDRQGSGGGGVGDNTSTNQGSLWKVRYAGSDAPFISIQPRGLTLPAGEDAAFGIVAGGAGPLSYQWQRDGVDLPGEDSAQLVMFQTTYADSGATFRCIVRNRHGSDSSNYAQLTITRNTRPLSTLLQPPPGQSYWAGDTIRFSGLGQDLEDGALPESALSWRVDLHHDSHTHPVVTALEGVASGWVVFPVVGETDPDVWLRFYLTTTDSGGLSSTVYRDIYPEKTQIGVYSDPPGMTINVDGKLVETPYFSDAVIGMQRTAVAPLVQHIGDSIYRFAEWLPGDSAEIQRFVVPEFGANLFVRYVPVPQGMGYGLLGVYYQEDSGSVGRMDTTPALLRIDPEIAFEWGLSPPGPAPLRGDFYSVRWRGEVQALFTETYRFHTITDDGVRLWVNDSLLIDKWIPQAATEHSGQIDLVAGQRYPIMMEYFESSGDALAKLLWSSRHTPRQLVPSRQLYPGNPLGNTGELHPESALIWPNPAQDQAFARLHCPVAGQVQLRLLDLQGSVLNHWQMQAAAGDLLVPFSLQAYPAGMYILEAKAPRQAPLRLRVLRR